MAQGFEGLGVLEKGWAGVKEGEAGLAGGAKREG